MHHRWFLCFSVLFFLFSFALGQTLPSFFQPAGTAYGDNTYTGLDDGYTPDYGVQLPSSFNFYGSSQSVVFVSSNGLLAFGQGDSSYTPQGPQAATKPIIALNWGDVDTRPYLNDGNMIYYRTETDTTRLSTLASDIKTKLQRNTNIILQWAFIVTYYKVGYYSYGTDLLNTYQAVVARDSNNKAYVVLNYGQLQWGACSAGFSLGDGINYVELPGSRSDEVRNLVSKSNVDQNGQFIYDISVDLQHPCKGVTDGTVCDDFNACTFDDVCMGEVCVGSSVTCTALDQCHVPGTCNPTTGQCSNPNAANGATCNDGNSCTQSDQCSSGVCVGSNPVTCAAASDQCHVPGTCNPTTGQCSAETRKTNGTACNDGNSCTQTDTCQSGVCTGANPKICTALDQCHVPGTCNPSTGQCSNPEKTNGASCSDGNSCTQTDTCQSGSCVGSNPVTCTALDQCHVPGTCNPSTGQCSNPNAANGATCNDGNLCTQSDTCQSGSCVGASPITCTALDQCHVPGTCNPSTGQCSNPNANNGTTCSDSNSCTQTDTCQGGSCVGANPVICTALDQCHVPGTCNPSTGQCSNPNAANGLSCSDGNSCTQTDVCQSGVCTGANPVICTALDQCHVPGTCNPTNGQCSNPNAANGTTCSDGDLCTLSDTCQGGICSGTAKTCTALDQCHVPGTCDPLNGECSNPNAVNGVSCSDGDLCTQTDTCQNGVCNGANPKICTAMDQCHLTGSCNATTGQCSNPQKMNGAVCDDNNSCTQSDTCQSGSCTGSDPVICTALDQCHVPGTCNPSNGQCSNPNAANGAQCNDENGCTLTDQCMSGVCVGENPKNCTALDQCHVPGTCNPSDGQCSNPQSPNGIPCDDSNLCTQTDQCFSGECVGTSPKECTALDQCHVPGICDPSSGECSDPEAADGTSCDDSDFCTEPDQCFAGECIGTAPKVCTALDECHVPGICDSDKAECSNPEAANGTTCDDNNACTSSDQCQSGTCAGTEKLCTSLDQCHTVGVCNPLTGQCSNPVAANGTTCNDGAKCTVLDKCSSGVCVGTAIPCPDGCDSGTGQCLNSTIIIPTTIPDDLNNLLNSGTTVHMSVSLFIIAVFVLLQ